MIRQHFTCLIADLIQVWNLLECCDLKEIQAGIMKEYVVMESAASDLFQAKTTVTTNDLKKSVFI